MSLLIKNGTIVNAEETKKADVYCEDGIIKAIGENLDIPDTAEVIDADGQYVMPSTLVHLDIQSRQNLTWLISALART